MMMKKELYNITHHAEVSEKAIEKYLVSETKKLGGLCLKYSNPNMVGYPDRLVLLPGGKLVWVELKSKGKKPSKVQALRFAHMASMGHPVEVCDSKQAVDDILGKEVEQ